MSIGERVVKAIDELNVKVGTDPNEKFNNNLSSEQAEAFRQQSINLWDAIGTAIQAEGIEYREVNIYDGTEKRLNPSQNHNDDFIPEDNFHDPVIPKFDYRSYERHKEDESVIPEFEDMPPTVSELRKGYRVIIKDDKVLKDSKVIPVIYYLDRNEENDLPDDYVHVSPGATSTIVSQINGEFQLFFEQKGCYKIVYTVWNKEFNLDSKPKVIHFTQTG